jgi:hypothetical protein
MDDIEGKNVDEDEIQNQYEGIAFTCLDCGDCLVTIRPGSAECYCCDRQYDVGIEITAAEKREKNNWPPD